MKLIKPLVFATLAFMTSGSVFAVVDSSELYNSNESTSNLSVNSSNYQFPTGTASGVLYNNGPLITSPGTGAGGLDESVLENTTLGMTSLGSAHQLSATARIADEFTIAGNDWTIDTITFYAYQTGEIASTITAVNLQIWDGVPGDVGSTVVFGDDTTNRMSNSVFSNIYRVAETALGSTNRQIAASTVDVNIVLPAGTYWLDWQSDGSGGSGPWAPPITIPGQSITGNGRQFFGGVWADVTDGGSGTALGFPFIINGSSQIIPIPAYNWYGLVLLLILIGFATRRFVKQ